MKKHILLLFFIFSQSHILIAQEQKMNLILENAVTYYMKDLIPKFYNGQEDFSEEMGICHMEYNFGMQGNGFSFMRGTKNIVFHFYYILPKHRKQTIQGLLLTSENINNKLYEYWIFNMHDHGIPYNYAFFYLTCAESLQSKRKIIDISTHYTNSYKLPTGENLNLKINELIVLYQASPWIPIESFENTIYENKIVKWRKNIPYLKNMNIFEKLYYKNLKKSDM